MKITASASILLLFAIGCDSSVYQYSKESGFLDKSQNGLIKCESGENYKLRILKVDGKKISYFPMAMNEVILSPGLREISVRYIKGGGVHADGSITIDVQPGKSYLIKRKIEGYRIIFFHEVL